MQEEVRGPRDRVKHQAQMPRIDAVQPTHAGTWKHCRLLVPIDFSEASVNALRYAGQLAGNKDAELTLLHVIDEPLSFRTLDFVGQQNARRRARLAQLDGLAHQVIEPGTPVKTVVCEGSPAEQISRVAAKDRSDVIIVGRHESRRFAHWLRLHTSAALANSAPCQVLVLAD